MIESAGAGRVPPITEYQASQPAFKPVAANASPDTPIVTCSGIADRIIATCSRAAVGSVGTPGILIDAIPGNSAIRAYSSVVNVKCVVPGLS